ncbi:MAG: Cell division protein FtsX, partial [Micrococcaceae bacterium]|nr:Cell division protein FtsX [Micrococcaceae bacterium]
LYGASRFLIDGWLVNTFPQTAFISSQQVLILVPALIMLVAILAGLSSLLNLRR